MAEDINTNVVNIASSFGSIITSLKKYTADESGNLTGKDAIALKGVISGLSKLQSDITSKDTNNISKQQNVVDLINGENGVIKLFTSIDTSSIDTSNITTIKTLFTDINNSLKQLNNVKVDSFDEIGIKAGDLANGLNYLRGDNEYNGLQGIITEFGDKDDNTKLRGLLGKLVGYTGYGILGLKTIDGNKTSFSAISDINLAKEMISSINTSLDAINKDTFKVGNKNEIITKIGRILNGLTYLKGNDEYSGLQGIITEFGAKDDNTKLRGLLGKLVGYTGYGILGLKTIDGNKTSFSTISDITLVKEMISSINKALDSINANTFKVDEKNNVGDKIADILNGLTYLKGNDEYSGLQGIITEFGGKDDDTKLRGILGKVVGYTGYGILGTKTIDGNKTSFSAVTNITLAKEMFSSINKVLDSINANTFKVDEKNEIITKIGRILNGLTYLKGNDEYSGLQGIITEFGAKDDNTKLRGLLGKVVGYGKYGILGTKTVEGNKTSFSTISDITLVREMLSSLNKALDSIDKLVVDKKNNVGDKIADILNGLKEFSSNILSLNTMTELDALPYLVASLKLGESKVTESYYENSDKRRISVAEFDKLDKDRQAEYSFKTTSKDLSIVESINLTSSFIVSVTKAIEKASSIPIHKALLAPIKIKLISNAITKSILSMIDVVNKINNIGNPKQIQDMLGWEDANNEYQIEGDSFVTEEYIDEDGKKQTRNKKNANYHKGRFAAESGIFKIGDYISSLVGTIDKLSNVSPLKILKTRIKISLTIKSIARTIRNILVAINSEMSGIDTSGVSKLMGTTIENVNNIVTESTDYTTNGNETISELTKKVIDNSTTKTTTQGPFDVMISFFNIYENMMKIAEVGGFKLFFKSKKAKFRINALTNMLGQLVNEIDKNLKTKTKADVLAERVKSIAQVFNSMKSVVDSIEKTAGGSKGRKARRAVRRLKDIVHELVGGLNEETMVYKYGLIDALIKLTRKYERSGLQEKAGVFKDMQTSFTDLSKMMTALAIIAPMSMIATVGLPTTFTVLFFVAGKKGVREKDGSIIGLMGRLSEKWEAYNKNSKSGIGKTLLMITGSLSLFIISLILAGKYAKEAFGGVLVISGVLALTLGIFWLISKINKGGVIKDGPIDRGGKTLLLISGSLLAFTLGLAVLSLVVTENQAALWHGVLQLSLMISSSVLLMFVVSKMTGSVIKGALVMLVIAGSWMLFAHTLQKISDAASSVSLKTLIVTVSALTLMIGGVAAIGAILSVPLAGAIALAIIGSGVAVMALVSGGFLMLAETMIKINEVFSTSSPNQVKENLKTMMDCLTDMVSHTKGMDKIERSQKRNMKRLSSITSSIGEMADVLRDIADFKIGIIDPNTGKITGYRNIEAADFQRAGDNAVMIVTKIEEIAKILSDEENSISRRDAKKAKKQAKRLNRISKITEPIQSAIELIQTIASGKITYTDETGKEVTEDLNTFFKTNTANVQDTLKNLISGIDIMFKDINVSDGKGIDEDTSNAMTARIEAMTGLLDTLGNSVNPSKMKNVTSLQDNTSKIVSTINSLNVDKADKLKDVLKDLKEFNSEVGDIFEKMEETMENLVDQLKKMNGMKTKSSETRQSPSAPASNAMTAKPVNLSNIEGDIDELLNELRGIKSILMR